MRFAFLVSSLVISLMCGCGESGPKMYDLSGTVRYDGASLPLGHIRFEPQQGVITKDTVTQAVIKNGEYQARVTGGPHRIMIRDMGGGEFTFPEVPNPRRFFTREYREEIELPRAEEVDEAQTRDFDIPATFD